MRSERGGSATVGADASNESSDSVTKVGSAIIPQATVAGLYENVTLWMWPLRHSSQVAVGNLLEITGAQMESERWLYSSQVKALKGNDCRQLQHNECNIYEKMQRQWGQ